MGSMATPYMYIYVYIHICMYVYVCMYIYVCIYIYRHVDGYHVGPDPKDRGAHHVQRRPARSVCLVVTKVCILKLTKVSIHMEC